MVDNMFTKVHYCLLLASCLLHSVHSSSFINDAIKHERTGRSVGRLTGKEVYEYEGHLYSFHLDPLTWEEAKLSCEEEGGYLAVLEDIQEVDFVSHAMDGDLCSFTAFQNVWIGGRFENRSERWYWQPTGYEIMGKIGDQTYPPWKIDLRPGYDCLNLDQDLTHKPKFTDLECFRKRRYLCEEGCSMLYDTDGGYWEPAGCAQEAQHTGHECTLICNPGYEVDGDAELQCTDKGWVSLIGLNDLPHCHDGNQIGQDIIDTINNTIAGRDVEFLFLVDESTIAGDKILTYQINFTQAIVRAFPLSATRSAGLITYSDIQRVHLPVDTDSSCRFIREADKVELAGSDESDIAAALSEASAEIETNRAHNLTIVFLLAASRNDSIDATLEAEAIKAGGDVIFSVSISEESDALVLRELASSPDLFFKADNPDILNMANRYIVKEYGDNLKENCSYAECDGLDNTDRGHWTPASCNDGALENSTCQLVCDPKYSVHGPAHLTCTANGWAGPSGPLTEVSECWTSEEVGEDFGDQINNTLSQYQKAKFLFILDESGSVSPANFQLELDFVKTIASAFPLSDIRRAGVITFSSTAAVDIPLTADDTCVFIKKVDKIVYSQGGTDIAAALIEGDLETVRNNPNEKTIIFLITDGASSTNPVAAADIIKAKGNLLFTVGVGSYDENQLIPISTVSEDGIPHFFGVSSFEIFQHVAEYLNETYIGDNAVDCSVACRQLSNTERGTWSPAECALANGNPGQACTLVCLPEYELKGSNPLVCGEDGWTGTGGDFNIPQCRTPDELGGDFVDKINSTLAGEIASNLLFVIDESGSVSRENFQMELDFIKAVVQAFPLSVNRSAGVITFDDTANVDIPLTTADTCQLIAGLNAIVYHGGGTDILTSLQLATTEIGRNALHDQTMIFLITDGASSTDPRPAADALKAQGVILFAVGVAGYNQAQLEPLTTTGPDGTTNFFGIKSFEVFQAIADYMNTTYTEDGNACPTRSIPKTVTLY